MDKNNLNVLLIAKNDWANIGAQYAKSLRSIGIEATMLVRNKHKFNYPDQGIIFKKSKEIMSYLKKAKIIHFMHSQVSIQASDLKGKKVVVSHTGSAYRNKYRELNKVFNPIVDLTIVGCSFSGKGAKNEQWIPGGVIDLSKLDPVYKKMSDKIIIGHFPSSSIMKKSHVIDECMKQVNGNFEFRYSDQRVSWIKQIKRMSECDIYIEKFVKNMGFGITVLEAAALGKIIVTTYSFENKYKETTGESVPFVCVKNKKDMIEKLEKIISLSDDELLEMKRKSRVWVEKYHSHKPVGERLLNLYKKIL